MVHPRYLDGHKRPREEGPTFNVPKRPKPEQPKTDAMMVDEDEVCADGAFMLC